MKFRSITNRIFVMIIPTILITMISFALLSYYTSNSRINDTINEKMHESLQAADLEIQLELYKNASVAIQFASYGKRMESDRFSYDAHEAILAEGIESNENTFGGGVWFEPYAFDADSYYFGPYLYIDGSGEVFYTREYSEYTDYFSEDWYIKGKNSNGEIVWSLVYYDPFSTMSMVTASKAFYNEDGQFIGMGTADMNIENIRSIVNGISVGETGKAFILGAQGEYISYMDDGKSFSNTMQTDADEALAALGRELLDNDSGTTTILLDGKEVRVYYMTMENVNWTLAITIEESEINTSTLNSFLIMTIIPIIGLIFVIIGSLFVARYLRRIINKVNDFADQAASGNLSERISVTEADEFGLMEQRLNVMITHMNDMSNRSSELLALTENASRLLKAVNNAATVLLSADEEEFEESLRQGMELMARCMDVDRIYIWQNEMEDGVLRYVQKFEWLNDTGLQGDTVSSMMGYLYSDSIPEWEPKLSRGECINGPLAELSQTERECLEPFNIKSILVIPVHLKSRFMCFISFDDCHKERRFTEDEINILRSASLMMASAMIRNETTARMREADERTRLMLDATPLCCNLWDKDYNNIDCNEEAVKLFELKDKQEYLDRFSELSPEYQPDGRLSSDKSLDKIKSAFRDGKVVFEWMHQKLDGILVPSEITLVRVRRGDGYIVAGYTRDLRESQKMMREIEHKDILLRTVNNAATILLQSEIDEFEKDLRQCMGMMAESANANRVHIWKNHTQDGELYCTRLYEWSEGDELPQRNDVTVDMSYSKNIPGWEKKLSAGLCINGLVRELSPAVQALLTPQSIQSILLVPVFLRDEFWGFVGFYDCQHERVFTADEEAILRSGSLLIAHAMLRNQMTLDIRAAVETAQSANRAKSDFLSNMSHEIRTPMNAITGMTAIGKAASDTERKDYAFGKIEDASNHLLGVINDILDMSKIEAGKLELSEVEFNFEKVLQKVVTVNSFRIDEKKQNFAVYLDRDIPHTLIGDDQRLTQVITNLLSNAVKFTPEQGSIRLDTHLVNEENGVCTIQVEVTDTGIGISEDQQTRLFRSFEQAENTTTRQYGGTGLGLAISKHIVDLMGGRIWIESEPGKGSKFTFTILIKSGGEEYSSPLAPGVNWNNVCVLAVDDELETREYFTAITDKLGIACDVASGGEEALRLIDTRGCYNIYFIDWRMPGMNGIELSQKIKERCSDKSVIIMISSIEWNEIEKEAKGAGVDKFLPKPLFPSSIADCINEVLGQQKVLKPSSVPDESVSFEGYRILLAEDVEINQEIVLAILEPTGLKIDCAVNGIEAVRMFRDAQERYDMIFMDVQMPEMDGLEATQQIRNIGTVRAKEIPIVAMTANVFREDIEKCKEVGMNGHVGKPLVSNEVFETLKLYLKR